MNTVLGVVPKRPGRLSTAVRELVAGFEADLALFEHPALLLAGPAKHQSSTGSATGPDGRLTCWMLGYISSSPLARKDETPNEHALRGYQELGDAFFSRSHGSFVAVILDRNEEVVRLFTDPYATRAVFRAESDEFFAFGSNPDQLRRLPGLSPALDYEAIVSYLAIGFTEMNRTFYRDITGIPGRSTLRLGRGESALETKASAHAPTALPLDQASDLYYDTFLKIVNQLADLYEIKKANLTGGTDTRLILSALSEERRRGIRFVTSESVFGSDSSPDAVIARLLADRFGLNHEVLRGSTKESTPVIGRQVRAGVRKFCGTFGTETVGGGLYSATQFLKPGLAANQKRMEEVKALLAPGFRPLFDEVVADVYRRIDENGACDKHYGFFLPHFWGSFFSVVYAAADVHWIMPFMLPQSAKVFPFLNTELIDLLMTMPREYLENYRIYGHLYRNRLKDYGEIPFHSAIVRSLPEFKSLNLRSSNHGKHRTAPAESDLFSELELFDETQLKATFAGGFVPGKSSTLMQLTDFASFLRASAEILQ